LERAKILVNRPDPAHWTVGSVELAGFGQALPQFRTDGFDRITLSLDGTNIINAQADFASGGITACLLAGSSAPNDDYVCAQRFHPVLLVAAESESQPTSRITDTMPPTMPNIVRKLPI